MKMSTAGDEDIKSKSKKHRPLLGGQLTFKDYDTVACIYCKDELSITVACYPQGRSVLNIGSGKITCSEVIKACS